MTNEEAIEILKAHNLFRLKMSDKDRHPVEVGVAIDHAINVLRAQPPKESV